MYVNVNFYKDAGKVGSGIRYISHREENLPEGTTRPLYGIGPRYRELQGDEAAIVRRLREDAAGLKEPHFFRMKFTVNDAVAERVMALPAPHREKAFRDAVDRTFRGAFREAQGAFVIHYHGGVNRPFGHPHVHANLSPRLQDGTALRYIRPERLARIKERWAREVEAAAVRYERRIFLGVPRTLGRAQERRAPRRSLLSDALERLATRALGRPSSALLRVQRDARATARPRRLLIRAGTRLFDAVAPAPLRAALRIARTIGRLSSGD